MITRWRVALFFQNFEMILEIIAIAFKLFTLGAARP